MAVIDIAREKVITVSPGDPVSAVVDAMADAGVGSVVVADGDEPVGVITDRDLVLRVLADNLDPDDTTADAVMTPDPVTVAGDEGVYDLLRLMAESGVRRVPVVEDGALVGIVTLDDVVILLGMEIGSVENIIRSESPPFEVPVTELYDD